MDPISSSTTSSTANACSYDELTSKAPTATSNEAKPTQKAASETANASYASGSGGSPVMATSKPSAIDLSKASVDLASWPSALLDRNYAVLLKEIETSPKTATPEKLDLLARMEKELATRDASSPPLAPVTKPPDKVELCEARVNNPLAEATPFKHWWLRTEMIEVGMGPATGGAPGEKAGYEGPGSSTALTDHTGRGAAFGAECVELPDVDPACVEKTEIGKPTGRWIPGLNDCHTMVEEIVRDCAVMPRTDLDDLVDYDF